MGLKKKTYGQFRARLIAREYTQIIGVDFTYKYLPLVTEVSLHVILLILRLRARSGYLSKFIIKWLTRELDLGNRD